jgi:hypothetical protein
VRRPLALVLASLPVLAACGGTTTTTVITHVVTPVTTTTTNTPTSTATPITTTTTSTATSAASVYFRGAVGRPAQRPSSLQLTADGTLSVGGVQWTSWGGTTAVGSGNASYHGCTPNCASAPTHTALVSIRLFGTRMCAGRQYYSGVTLTLNSGQLLDKQFLQRSWSPC